MDPRSVESFQGGEFQDPLVVSFQFAPEAPQRFHGKLLWPMVIKHQEPNQERKRFIRRKQYLSALSGGIAAVEGVPGEVRRFQPRGSGQIAICVKKSFYAVAQARARRSRLLS